MKKIRADRYGTPYPADMLPDFEEWELRSMGIVADDPRTHGGGARSETVEEVAAAEGITVEQAEDDKQYFAKRRKDRETQ